MNWKKPIDIRGELCFNATMSSQNERVNIYIPLQTLAAIDRHFFDVGTGKPQYGARSRLITELLDKWLAEHHPNTTQHGDKQNA